MKKKKLLVKHLLNNIGGAPRIYQYVDNRGISKIDIFISKNHPYPKIDTYSTLGLSEYDIDFLSENRTLRVELLGASYSCFDKFANIISSCSFNIINDNFLCLPGVIYPNIIDKYYPDSNMKHILFTYPFLWNIDDISDSNRIITWLMIIPISDQEFSFVRKNNFELLEDLFEKKQIDIFDLYRNSVL